MHALRNTSGASDGRRIDFVSCGNPRFDAAFERPHSAKTFVEQEAGDTRRARFIRSTAVDHYVAVFRNLVEHVCYRGQLDQDCAANDSGLRLASDSGAHVENNRLLPFVDH